MPLKTIADPNVRTELMERVKTLEPGLRPQWGRMTAHQMLCHCTDSFKVVFGEKQARSVVTPLNRMVIRHIALRVPRDWPRDLPTRPEVEQGSGGTPPGDFAADRKALLAQLERFSGTGSDFDSYMHPMFGKLSKWEGQRWAFLHLDHHLRQFGR